MEQIIEKYSEVCGGVRQDLLSPIIFIAAQEMIFSKLNYAKTELNIEDIFISHLRFADDIILFSESANEMVSMIHSQSAVEEPSFGMHGPVRPE